MRIQYALLAGATASLLAGPAGAQTVPAQDTGGPAKAETIETVVVTARRREEDLQRVPVAITAFSQAALDQQRIQNATDLQYLVPSLSVTGVFNRNQEFFTLRGQGETGTNVSSAPGGGPAVVTYFAEVPLASGGGARLFYDLSSLQVLKGPQGTLFGRNTTGGAVLVEPKRPTNDFGGYADVTFGDYGDLEQSGAINVPIVDDELAVRFAFQRIQQDGYTTDVGPFFPGRKYDDENSFSGRLGVEWTPNDWLQNYLVAYYERSADHGPGQSVLGVNPASAAAGFDPLLLTDLANQQARGPRYTSLSTFQYDLLKDERVQDTLTVRLADNIHVKNIVSYTQSFSRDASDRDGTPEQLLDAIGSAPYRWHSDVQDFTEELQVQGTSLGDVLQWQAGIYGESTHGTRTNYNQIEFFGLANNFLADAELYSSSIALYSQATYAITPDLHFTAGYRYTWDNLKTEIALGASFGGPPATPFFGGQTTHSGWSGTLGLDYQIDSDQMVYVTSRRGYKSGGFNVLALGSASPFFNYAPESDVDVEVGYKAKGNLGSMPYLLDVDAFQTWYSNAQVAVSEVIGGQASGVTTNAAAADLRGLEFQGTLLPAEGLQLSIGYSYNVGNYTKYFSPVSGDLSDTPITNMPMNKFNANVQYDLPIDARWGTLTAIANYSVQSKFFAAGQLGDPFAFIGGYSLLNLRLDWKNIFASNFNAGIFVTNATDTLYQTSVVPLYTSDFGFSSATYGPPRMIGGEVRYTF